MSVLDPATITRIEIVLNLPNGLSSPDPLIKTSKLRTEIDFTRGGVDTGGVEVEGGKEEGGLGEDGLLYSLKFDLSHAT